MHTNLSTFLWFDRNAGAAARLYCEIFPDGKIIPRQLMELMSDPDPARSQRVVQAMLKMVKIDVAALQRAHAGT